MTKFLVSYSASGSVIVEATSRDAAQQAVEDAVRDRRIEPQVMAYAKNLDTIPEILA